MSLAFSIIRTNFQKGYKPVKSNATLRSQLPTETQLHFNRSRSRQIKACTLFLIKSFLRTHKTYFRLVNERVNSVSLAIHVFSYLVSVQSLCGNYYKTPLSFGYSSSLQKSFVCRLNFALRPNYNVRALCNPKCKISLV